jgi:hypothetical protein
MSKPRDARLRRLEEERKVRVDERLGDKCGTQLTSAFDGFPWHDIAKVRDKSKEDAK